MGLISDVVPSASFATELANRVALYHKSVEAITIGRRALRIAGPSGSATGSPSSRH